ncbi:DUF881 domain-containing protein [Dethiothermospora halolimnae]|uniref:DUF881 domain-containing protein n=1 Tax=Dethiothermospora halolimnae TaxID=3114390 RepID=UPI003CCC1AF2
MKNLKNKLAITIVCIILGIIIAIQFKTVRKTVGEDNIIPTQRAEQLAVELKKLKEEKKNLLKELEDVENKVEQYEKGEADKNDYVQNLSDKLKKYRMLGGYEPVDGPGVIVTLNDPNLEAEFSDGTSTLVNRYEFILQIISNLNAAGAEAISINGQRYTGYTEIEPAAQHLMINGTSTDLPVEIKAIGNPQNLENSLRLYRGAVWYMENEYYIQVDIEKEENVEIPKYTKIKEFRYAETMSPIGN